MLRDSRSSYWIFVGLSHAASGVLAGAVTGVLLGLLGGAFADVVRDRLVTIGALIALTVGVLNFLGKGLRPPQFDRETDRAWLGASPLRWAILNGTALGIGIVTRLGFWAWYLIPGLALLSGAPLLGGLTYAVYGGVRTASVFGWFRGQPSSHPSASEVTRVLSWNGAARRLSALTLIVAGILALAR